jgi:hypothetical protein
MYSVTAHEPTNTWAIEFRFKPGGTRSPSRRPIQPCTAGPSKDRDGPAGYRARQVPPLLAARSA